MAVMQPGQEPSSGNGDDVWSAARAAGAVSNDGLPDGSATITLWADGFTVNDGPLRPLADPKNKKFVDDIQKGECPEELREGSNGQPVSIAVKDNRPRKYEPPIGTTAGAQSSSSTRPIQPGQADLSQGATAGPTATGTASVSVDEGKPVTTIMVRFGDGRRQTQQFNEDALVMELFKFVEECTGTAEFKLTEGFPPKPIIDKTATLKAAGLLKASINVKN